MWNYIKSYMFLFSLQAEQLFLEHSRTFMVGFFPKKVNS